MTVHIGLTLIEAASNCTLVACARTSATRIVGTRTMHGVGYRRPNGRVGESDGPGGGHSTDGALTRTGCPASWGMSAQCSGWLPPIPEGGGAARDVGESRASDEPAPLDKDGPIGNRRELYVMGRFGKKEPSEDQAAADAQRTAEKERKRAEKEQKKAEKEQKKAAAKQKDAEQREQQAVKLEAKAREKATKKGLDLDGALIVAHDLSKDSAWETLIVWPDRVEKHNHGKVGSIFGSGKGVESMPIGNVASVEARNDGIYGRLDVHGSGNSIGFRTSQPQAHRIRGVVMDLMQKAKATQTAKATLPSQPAATLSVAEQIKQLGELRDAGLVSEEEFEAKRKELLDRM